MSSPTPAGPLRLSYAALSDVGRVRKDNQDSGYAGSNLLVIADGVGGAARGDIASSTAVQILRRLDVPPPADLLEALAGAIHRAHDRLGELVEEDPELEGTSTTVTAALFDGARIGIGHVGDSRGYLLRDGVLSQLTKDHTFVQSLVDEGRITEDEARTHPHKNLILRAVDGVHDTDPDLFIVDLAPGDRILLCSDGLSGVFGNDRLGALLGDGTLDFAVVELVRAALEAGSTDNITCVVADVVEVSDETDPTSAEATTGPMLVGAAAEQPRRAGQGAKTFFRGHRGGDTGELEPVPSGGGTPTTDTEELRYAPQPPRRRRWIWRVLALLVVLAVIAAALVAGYRWTQTQYYVAADGQDVVIYRGLQADLPGIDLSSVHERTGVTLQSLPAYRADTVRAGITADDLDDAHAIVDRLYDLALSCPSPEPSPTSRATSGKKGQNKAQASPSPSPEPTLAPPDCIERTP